MIGSTPLVGQNLGYQQLTWRMEHPSRDSIRVVESPRSFLGFLDVSKGSFAGGFGNLRNLPLDPPRHSGASTPRRLGRPAAPRAAPAPRNLRGSPGSWAPPAARPRSANEKNKTTSHSRQALGCHFSFLPVPLPKGKWVAWGPVVYWFVCVCCWFLSVCFLCFRLKQEACDVSSGFPVGSLRFSLLCVLCGFPSNKNTNGWFEAR